LHFRHFVILHPQKGRKNKAFEDLFPCILSGPVLGGVSIASTTQGRASAMLISLILGNYKVRSRGGLKWYDVHTKFCEDRLTGSGV
jgi:hypothetical protein